jgi:16S rRNA (cytidine1402-2'-O)-methyltransferase
VSGGRLVLVGTPIGNLDDVSVRAVKSLADADVIYCEDTRRARKLLSALGVPAPRLLRLDQHNERALAPEVADAVERGSNVALITDAGMPTVSDPGSAVVREVSGRGLTVEAVPGPSAITLALALSGFDTTEYRFVGFPPRQGRARQAFMTRVSSEPETTVIYESPHRVSRTVADLAERGPTDRPVALAKELTKLHEQVWRGDLGAAAEWLASGEEPLRGEWVVVLGPAPDVVTRDVPSDEQITAALERAGMTGRQAIDHVAGELGVAKRRVYALAIAAKKGDSARPAMP